MRKLLALSVVTCLGTAPVFASGNHPMAGCGLAYLLFAKDKNTQGMQILASTTNNCWGTQSFGITSGTAGCTQDGKLTKNTVAELYAEVNLKELSRDMAIGQGEYLNTFASIMGVSESNRPEFFKLVKERYAVLFPSAETSATDMLQSLTQEMASHPEIVG